MDICFDLRNDFFDQFSRTVCGIRVAAAHKSSDKSLKFIAEGKLNVVTVVPRLFGIVPFDSALLMAFHVDHDDKDCPSHLLGSVLVLAGMVWDDKPCVQAFIRSGAFKEGYTDQVGVPVSPLPASCPMP